MNQVSQYPGEFIQGVGNTPSTCLVLPFEPQVTLKSTIEYRLKDILAKVESRLLQKYATHEALPVLTKLQQLVAGINYCNYKKSIAILASPHTAKVFYLNFSVTETVRIDEYLDVRDIVRAKSNASEYLVMILGTGCVKLYFGTPSTLSCIKYNLQSAGIILPERTTDCPDPSSSQSEKGRFLRRIDQGLGFMLNAWPLPVFILGEKPLAEQFKHLTVHAEHIVGYLHKDFDTTTETDILMALQPELDHWKKTNLQLLLQKMDKARRYGKLACGIKEVWNRATHRRAQLLVVEENYLNPVRPGPAKETIYSFTRLPDDPYYMQDVVEDIIGKVLKDGGDVEFVEKGALGDYQQIALIEHHNGQYNDRSLIQ